MVLGLIGMSVSGCAHRESAANLELLAIQRQHALMDLIPQPMPSPTATQPDTAEYGRPASAPVP